MAKFIDEGMKDKLQDVIKIGLILVIAGAVVGLLTHFSEFGILGMWITALATAAIAFYSFMSYQLTLRIQARDDEFRKDIQKIYKGLVISNLIDPTIEITGEQGERAIQVFNDLYEKGKTESVSLQFP